MTEKELRTRFEDLTLDPSTFSHAEHVRLAWAYLRDMPLAEVLRIFPGNLRRFATAAGAPGKYDEAMTVSYLEIIAERVARASGRTSWAEFIDENRDLLNRELLGKSR